MTDVQRSAGPAPPRSIRIAHSLRGRRGQQSGLIQTAEAFVDNDGFKRAIATSGELTDGERDGNGDAELLRTGKKRDVGGFGDARAKDL